MGRASEQTEFDTKQVCRLSRSQATCLLERRVEISVHGALARLNNLSLEAQTLQGLESKLHLVQLG